MSGTFAAEQPSAVVADLREAASTNVVTGEVAREPNGSFVVTIRTPAGHERRFRVTGDQRVETVTRRALAYFVSHGELAEGKYVLAVLRDSTPEDMTASGRLEDYGVREGDVLVLIVGEPQVDG